MLYFCESSAHPFSLSMITLRTGQKSFNSWNLSAQLSSTFHNFHSKLWLFTATNEFLNIRSGFPNIVMFGDGRDNITGLILEINWLLTYVIFPKGAIHPELHTAFNFEISFFVFNIWICNFISDTYTLEMLCPFKSHIFT